MNPAWHDGLPTDVFTSSVVTKSPFVNFDQKSWLSEPSPIEARFVVRSDESGVAEAAVPPVEECGVGPHSEDRSAAAATGHQRLIRSFMAMWNPPLSPESSRRRRICQSARTGHASNGHFERRFDDRRTCDYRVTADEEGGRSGR